MSSYNPQSTFIFILHVINMLAALCTTVLSFIDAPVINLRVLAVRAPQNLAYVGSTDVRVSSHDGPSTRAGRTVRQEADEIGSIC